MQYTTIELFPSTWAFPLATCQKLAGELQVFEIEESSERYSIENGQIVLDQVKDAAYQIKKAELESKEQSNLVIMEKIKQGERVEKLSKNIFNLITGYNFDRQLTGEQVTSLETLCAPIMSLLKNNRPFHAKALIQAFEVDGVLITQEMKDSALSLYDNF